LSVQPTPGEAHGSRRVPLGTIAREWTRIGVTGFGGPPAHIALLRQLVVARKSWLDGQAFEDANAAVNLLPGPASTQLAIFSAYRVGGPAGAVIGGLGFVVPAVLFVLALSVVFLSRTPPLWIRGAGAGAGAAVAPVAVRAGIDLLRPSYGRARERAGLLGRWGLYLVVAAAAAATIGPYLVLVLLGCGIVELALRHPRSQSAADRSGTSLLLVPIAIAKGSVGALAWTALKVGGLAFGGGFVIIPLMQGDAVHTYHWMSNAQFLNAVALGQVTPGPVVATVAAVGYAAHGLAGGLIASAVAFIPSFSFVLLGGRSFERLRANRDARAFLDGAGPAAIGAILGAAIPLTRALTETWQFAVLAAAAVMLLVVRRGIVLTLVLGGAAGTLLALAGAPVPR
jgi:chromate transporter